MPSSESDSKLSGSGAVTSFAYPLKQSVMLHQSLLCTDCWGPGRSDLHSSSPAPCYFGKDKCAGNCTEVGVREGVCIRLWENNGTHITTLQSRVDKGKDEMQDMNEEKLGIRAHGNSPSRTDSLEFTVHRKKKAG